jgi:hypothetical protein
MYFFCVLQLEIILLFSVKWGIELITTILTPLKNPVKCCVQGTGLVDLTGLEKMSVGKG